MLSFLRLFTTFKRLPQFASLLPGENVCFSPTWTKYLLLSYLEKNAAPPLSAEISFMTEWIKRWLWDSASSSTGLFLPRSVPLFWKDVEQMWTILTEYLRQLPALTIQRCSSPSGCEVSYGGSLVGALGPWRFLIRFIVGPLPFIKQHYSYISKKCKTVSLLPALNCYHFVQ